MPIFMLSAGYFDFVCSLALSLHSAKLKIIHEKYHIYEHIYRLNNTATESTAMKYEIILRILKR